jgi:prepilin-type N-terminal cleavage/methylation domain-containing protein
MRLRGWLRRADGEGGFTLIELLVAMTILGLVLGGIGGLFASGIKSESDLNSRFRAQTELGVAMDKLKRDLHSACKQTATYSGGVDSVTIQAPSTSVTPASCNDANGNDIAMDVTWCVRQVGTATRYQLFRIVGTTCTGGTQYADYITSATPFTLYPYDVSAASAPNLCNPHCYLLARLHVDLTVDVDPNGGAKPYRLVNDIAFRNSRLV